MDLYLRFFRMLNEMYAEYTNLVEPYGIDEDWLDVTASSMIKGDGLAIVRDISARVKEELGITVSIGVSFNKIFAKLGSDYKKPDGITTMGRDEFRTKAWTLPASDLLYVGRSTEKKLALLGIHTIGDLARTDERIRQSHLGKMGSVLYGFANGWDDSPVRMEQTYAPIKSIGNSTTTFRDLVNNDDVKIILYALSESVAARLRENSFKCNVVEVPVRDNGLFHFTRQRKLPRPTNITTEIAEVAFALFRENYRWEKPIRSLGVRGADLTLDHAYEQYDLFMDYEYRDKMAKVDMAVDDIRRRFGYQSVQRGLMYLDRSLSALDAKGDHTVHPRGYFGQ